jgi:hypothetical protein
MPTGKPLTRYGIPEKEVDLLFRLDRLLPDVLAGTPSQKPATPKGSPKPKPRAWRPKDETRWVKDVQQQIDMLRSHQTPGPLDRAIDDSFFNRTQRDIETSP